MFGYFSLLVEFDCFEEVHTYFLIVGHTHGCLDRYYSHLGHYIDGAYFIGSPLSLQSLFQTAPISENGIIPAVNRQVRAFYDMKKFLKPFLNPNIHNYQIPHIFRFRKIFGRCYKQYKLFTGHKWLPPVPSSIVSRELLDNAPIVDKIFLRPLSSVGGASTFYKALGINAEPLTMDERIAHNPSDNEVNLRATYKYLLDIERKGYAEDAKRMADQDILSGESFERYAVEDSDLPEIFAENSESEGFIFWLDVKGKQPVIDFRQLEVINPLSMCYAPVTDTIARDDQAAEGSVVSSETLTELGSQNLKYVRRQDTKDNRGWPLRAQAYARAANTALTSYRSGAYGESDEFSYKKPALIQAEVNFFESSSTELKALQVLDKDIQHATRFGYTLFPLEDLSEDQIRVLMTRKLADSKVDSSAVDLCNRLLVRRGQGAVDGQEILTRPGLQVQIANPNKLSVSKSDLGAMTLKPLQELAKSLNITTTEFGKNGRTKNRTVADLRVDIKRAIELSGSSSIPVASSSRTETAGTASLVQGATAADSSSITMQQQSNSTTLESNECSVYECQFPGNKFCVECNLWFCASPLLHESHSSHSKQHRKPQFHNVAEESSQDLSTSVQANVAEEQAVGGVQTTAALEAASSNVMQELAQVAAETVSSILRPQQHNQKGKRKRLALDGQNYGGRGTRRGSKRSLGPDNAASPSSSTYQPRKSSRK